MNHELAIIDPNTLAALGLQRLLEEVFPMAAIRTFPNFATFMDDTPVMYAHYFVAAAVYFEHTVFFRERARRTIVLVERNNLPHLSGIHCLNIQANLQQLVTSILQLHNCGHHPITAPQSNPMSEHDLSAREIEVLSLLVRGYIHKEIADRLHISLTTVITHRKNITTKLGIKSLSGLTIYAVMHGYVAWDSI